MTTMDDGTSNRSDVTTPIHEHKSEFEDIQSNLYD